MQILRKLSTVGGRLGAMLVAVVTLAIVAHAVQTVVTPNALHVTYNLASGANSAAITPASNLPVFVMGVQTAVGFRGVGEVSLLHVPASFLEWTGLESPFAAAITSGFSGTAGTHIVFLDFSHTVDIQVHSADSFVIHNASGGNATGNVTLIW
jgi:hypothetical protein